MMYPETDTDSKKKVYRIPAVLTRYRKTVKPGPRTVLDEFIERFQRAADEKEVAATVRQLAASCAMSKSSVENAIKVLVNDGFLVVVSKGTYENKRKPSRYRLTMFPCRGRGPTNDFIDETKVWRRSGRKPSSVSMPKKIRMAFDVSPEQAATLAEAYDRITGAGFSDDLDAAA